MCVVIPIILDVRLLVDAPAGVTQGFSTFLLARRIQPSLSLVDREVEFCVPKT